MNDTEMDEYDVERNTFLLMLDIINSDGYSDVFNEKIDSGNGFSINGFFFCKENNKVLVNWIDQTTYIDYDLFMHVIKNPQKIVDLIKKQPSLLYADLSRANIILTNTYNIPNTKNIQKRSSDILDEN